jgi:hypothetical protein
MQKNISSKNAQVKMQFSLNGKNSFEDEDDLIDAKLNLYLLVNQKKYQS